MSETELAASAALKDWREKQDAHIAARETCRTEWAQAFLRHADLKPEAARKAKADLETTDVRKRRDDLETVASEAWQAFLVLRGPMDHARQPGQHFGEA